MKSQRELNFKVLPIRFSHTSTSFHSLFLKEHSVRHIDERKPPGKTLFILNVPPYATEDNLKLCFSIAGSVNSVIFENDNHVNDGFKRGYVIFDKRESLLNIMKLDMLNPLSSDKKPIKIGLASWTEGYNAIVCDPKELQNRINFFMANYDKAEEEKNDKKDIVDDEGWTVVTNRGRRPGIDRKNSIGNKLKKKLKVESDRKELKNFYTFQIREFKMKNIATLRKNFEEAKNKVNAMKRDRRFKPF